MEHGSEFQAELMAVYRKTISYHNARALVQETRPISICITIFYAFAADEMMLFRQIKKNCRFRGTLHFTLTDLKL